MARGGGSTGKTAETNGDRDDATVNEGEGKWVARQRKLTTELVEGSARSEKA